jgi:hypothetical protein
MGPKEDDVFLYIWIHKTFVATPTIALPVRASNTLRNQLRTLHE